MPATHDNPTTTGRTPTAVPSQRRAGGSGAAGLRRPPVLLAGAVTTVWAAVVSVAPVIGAVVLLHLVGGGDGGTGVLIRVGIAGWLLAHKVPLHTGLGPIGLAPLAVTALAAWRLIRAGVHTTRAIGGRRGRSPRLAALAALSVGAVYGLLGALAAVAVSTPGLRVSVGRAALTLAVFGLVAGGVGALRESGLYVVLARRAPAPLRDGLRTGTVAALLVLAAGAAAAGTALALAGGDASRVLAAYHTGVAGQAGLTVLCLVYAPDLAIWAASYLVGPGFALGAGTTVSAGRVALGDLPAVPALAGLPAEPAGAWGALLLGVPLAAGMAAGWLLARRRSRGADAAAGWPGLLGAAAIGGPVAGGVLALAALAASGPVGAVRLAVIGPAALPVAAVGAGLVAAGAVAAAAATRALVGVRRRDP
jgi:Family of unknown function (DUF6350)